MCTALRGLPHNGARTCPHQGLPTSGPASTWACLCQGLPEPGPACAAMATLRRKLPPGSCRLSMRCVSSIQRLAERLRKCVALSASERIVMYCTALYRIVPHCNTLRVVRDTLRCASFLHLGR
eukprot:314333-Chlamydomonas_euryale.AAC.3